MTLLEKILTTDYIHVIENFYPDLTWLENHINKAEFSAAGNVNYPGLTSPPPPGIEATFKKITDLLGSTEIQFVHYDGQVRYTRLIDKGTEKTRIHTDENRIIILVHLSDVPAEYDPAKCGTSFFMHKKLKRKKFVAMDPIRDEFQRVQNIKDTKNPDLWEEWFNVPFKKNQALIYDGNLYHSPPELFYGDDIRNGRITQHFFPVNLKAFVNR